MVTLVPVHLVFECIVQCINTESTMPIPILVRRSTLLFEMITNNGLDQFQFQLRFSPSCLDLKMSQINLRS